jgi:hypothetical protein
MDFNTEGSSSIINDGPYLCFVEKSKGISKYPVLQILAKGQAAPKSLAYIFFK